MSVINQMLRDLEHRRAQGYSDEDGLLDRLDAGEAPASPVRGGWLNWILVGLLIVVLVALGWFMLSDRFAASSGKPVAETRPVDVPSAPEPVSRVVTPIPPADTDAGSDATPPAEPAAPIVSVSRDDVVSPPAVAAVEVEASKVVPEPQPGPVVSPLRVTAMMPSPVIATGQREKIAVHGEGFIEPLQVSLEWDGGRAFKQLEPWQVQVVDATQLWLHFNPGTESEQWRLFVERPGAEQSVDYVFEVVADSRQPAVAAEVAAVPVTEAPAPPAVVLNKQQRVLSNEEQAKHDYAEATRALQAGDTRNAEQSLRGVLRLDAQHLAARQALAALLFRAQRFDEATEVLETGRLQQPGHVPFNILLARIYAERGRDPDAITVLESATPGVAGNSDYYALLAALYQRGGNSEKAAVVYRQLVSAYPARGVWWMGLGLSLQSLQQAADARLAYSRALSDQGLSPELKRFVQSRLERLAP